MGLSYNTKKLAAMGVVVSVPDKDRLLAPFTSVPQDASGGVASVDVMVAASSGGPRGSLRESWPGLEQPREGLCSAQEWAQSVAHGTLRALKRLQPHKQFEWNLFVAADRRDIRLAIKDQERASRSRRSAPRYEWDCGPLAGPAFAPQQRPHFARDGVCLHPGCAGRPGEQTPHCCVFPVHMRDAMRSLHLRSGALELLHVAFVAAATDPSAPRIKSLTLALTPRSVSSSSSSSNGGCCCGAAVRHCCPAAQAGGERRPCVSAGAGEPRAEAEVAALEFALRAQLLQPRAPCVVISGDTDVLALCALQNWTGPWTAAIFTQSGAHLCTGRRLEQSALGVRGGAGRWAFALLALTSHNDFVRASEPKQEQMWYRVGLASRMLAARSACSARALCDSYHAVRRTLESPERFDAWTRLVWESQIKCRSMGSKCVKRVRSTSELRGKCSKYPPPWLIKRTREQALRLLRYWSLSWFPPEERR